MIGDDGTSLMRQVRQVAQDLRLAITDSGEYGRVLDGIDGIENVLRGLCCNQVRDTHLGVHPEVRRDLCAGTQRDIEIVGDIELGQAELGCLGAIYVEVQIRAVQDLMDVGIDNSRDTGDPALNLSGEREIRGVESLNLDVNRRRQSEIQNLTHDVGRLEIEGQVREGLRQLLAHLRDIFTHRMVTLLKSKENLTIK